MSKSSCTEFIVRSIALSLLGVGASQAALIDRGGGLIYDDVKNVTWMQDTQYALTSGYSASGLARLARSARPSRRTSSTTISVRDVTWGDWRLPTAVNSPQSAGYDPTGASSELAYMYYVNLGLAPTCRRLHAPRSTPRSRTTCSSTWWAVRYWTGTARSNPTGRPGHFQFGYGLLRLGGGNVTSGPWLVTATSAPALSRIGAGTRHAGTARAAASPAPLSRAGAETPDEQHRIIARKPRPKPRVFRLDQLSFCGLYARDRG